MMLGSLQGSRKRRHDQSATENPQTFKKQHAATRRNLPVFKYKNEICRLIAENEVILVVAETVGFSD
jgi:HrpA-like RNA helicase